jgi:hypothetical protein
MPNRKSKGKMPELSLSKEARIAGLEESDHDSDTFGTTFTPFSTLNQDSH